LIIACIGDIKFMTNVITSHHSLYCELMPLRHTTRL
jgi:hypothetical protein